MAEMTHPTWQPSPTTPSTGGGGGGGVVGPPSMPSGPAFASTGSFLTRADVGGIPNWAWLAGMGIGVALIFSSKRPKRATANRRRRRRRVIRRRR